MRFVTLVDGEQRWGPFGAAGLLLRHVDTGGTRRFLLMLRAEETHAGGVWALPGGALDEGEAPVAGALRETCEELGGLPAYRIASTYADDHGGWTYTSVTADVDELWQPPAPNWEVADTRWVRGEEVAGLALHPRLALVWHHLDVMPGLDLPGG